MASIKDVAELAEVSISTVSRVMNNHPNVSEEKREAVKEAVEELNYIPNALAQSLVTKSTKSIGILIADITNDFYSCLVRGIEDVLNEEDYFTILGNTDWDKKKEQNYINYFKRKQIDGFILASTTLKKSIIKKLSEELPVVVLDRDVESDKIDSIRINDYKGGYIAAKHLLNAGYRKVIHLKGPAGIVSAEDREKGYLKCMDEAKIANPKVIQGCYMEECGYKGIKKYLKNNRLKKPLGIFAANDAMAFGVLRYLKETKIKCPEEIGIVGFDDVNFAVYSNPSLTTIHRPINEIGQEAARILLARLKDKDIEYKSIRDVKLIKRESSKIFD